MDTKTETIVTAFAHRESGPGWVNHPVWVVIRNNSTGELRMDAIQPEDQNEEMRTLYGISCEVQKEMVIAVDLYFRNQK